ncbi:MAG: hypothetical protein ACXAC8_06755 [Candidatus Hodarchaeales archaeon]|jgi:hypothetical protein
MKVDENWAIFVNQQSQIEWAFGNPDMEFLQFTVNFLKGLGNIALEIFGENSVASIEVEHSGLKISEIFIVSLQNQFFFICSDPDITLKLIAIKEGLPKAMEVQIAAVLVGQAAILFAHSVSYAKSEDEQVLIEKSFQEMILDINPNLADQISMICSKSSSNFSMLSFNDLLLLHYHIRKHETLTDQPTGLVLVFHVDGGDLPFSWNVDRDVVMAGYLGVIINFAKTLFGGSVRRLVFGTHELRKLDFIRGTSDEFFMVTDSSFAYLCQDREFLQSLNLIRSEVFLDLEPQLKQYIIQESLDHAASLLNTSRLHSILQAYNGLSKDSESLKNKRISQMLRKLLEV